MSKISKSKKISAGWLFAAEGIRTAAEPCFFREEDTLDSTARKARDVCCAIKVTNHRPSYRLLWESGGSGAARPLPGHNINDKGDLTFCGVKSVE